MTLPSVTYRCVCGVAWEWTPLAMDGVPTIRICAGCGTVVMMTIMTRPRPAGDGSVSAEGASWAMEDDHGGR